MKFRIAVSLFFTIFFSGAGMEIYACHSKDLGAINKGHYIWSKNSGGLSRYTESSTISLSTSTNCKLYTAFILKEYDLLAEEAALGQGEHLVALNEFAGCPTETSDQFSSLMHAHYNQIFSHNDQIRVEAFQARIRDLISNDAELSKQCSL